MVGAVLSPPHAFKGTKMGKVTSIGSPARNGVRHSAVGRNEAFKLGPGDMEAYRWRYSNDDLSKIVSCEILADHLLRLLALPCLTLRCLACSWPFLGMGMVLRPTARGRWEQSSPSFVHLFSRFLIVENCLAIAGYR